KEVEESLRRAREVQPKAVEVTLLQSEILIGQGQFDRARELLIAARDSEPEQVAWWAALASLAERQKNPDEAHRLLTEAAKHCGDRVELYICWARFWTAHGGDDAKQHLIDLTAQIDKFRGDDQGRLLRELTEALCRVKEFQRAEQVWSRLAKQD